MTSRFPDRATIVRPPAVSGRFYPGNAKELALEIDRLLADAASLSDESSARPVGICVPHAGYIYSGSVAARAWSRVRHLDPDVVVLVGPDHFTGFPHVAVYGRGAFGTPLGPAPVDEDLAQAILSAGGPIVERPEVHAGEHSLEVQVPFVQRLFPGARILPILMGFRSSANVESLVEALAAHLPGRNALLVASSDLSHYHDRTKAQALDSRILSRFGEMNPEGLRDDLAQGAAEACGGDPLVTVLATSKRLGAVRSPVLEYADSGRVNGDTGSVVGYMAAAIEESPSSGERTLTPAEARELLQLAREAVSRAVRGEPDRAPRSPVSDALRELGAAFVTLRCRGQLRGCVGFHRPLFPLAETVIRVARAAAVEDGRFEPVAVEEAEALDVEISILGPLQRIEPDAVEIGRHGLYVSLGERHGLLLPQVAVEHRWTPVQFLGETCRKAGLPEDAWRNGATIEVFETLVITGGA
jgi:AmmeMemoRadiSam system protein B/AmmeMemoRadiSam system protein A